MLWFPVTEIEIERTIKSLKGKPSAGVDENTGTHSQKLLSLYHEALSTHF
jgi:hypothetical protein